MLRMWKVSKTYAGGYIFWQVYRIRNEMEVDHAGNREVYGTFDTKEEAEKCCDTLNSTESGTIYA